MIFETKNKKTKKVSCKKGFSIGEAMLSVFILGVTMVTILSLYTKGLREFQDERDSIIASMLAQEGVELVRNIRDNNWAERDAVDDVVPEAFNGIGNGSDDNSCIISFSDASVNCNPGSYQLRTVVSGSAPYQNFYTTEVNYGGVANENTKFRRRIVLDFNGNKEVLVISIVSWNNVNPPTDISSCITGNKCVFSESTLTDWGTGT